MKVQYETLFIHIEVETKGRNGRGVMHGIQMAIAVWTIVTTGTARVYTTKIACTVYIR